MDYAASYIRPSRTPSYVPGYQPSPARPTQVYHPNPFQAQGWSHPIEHHGPTLPTDDDAVPELPFVELTKSALYHLKHSGQRGGDDRFGDLILGSQKPISNSRNQLVVCLYHNSDKDWQSWYISLMKHRQSSLYRSDREFFKALQDCYRYELRSPLRRVISFKSVSTVRLIEVIETYPALFSDHLKRF